MTTRIGYAGDISPGDAYDILSRELNSVLIDVRSRPEWIFVGLPDLGGLGKEPLLVEWQAWPEMAVSENFVEIVKAAATAQGATEETSLLFLCRSGARSASAARAMTSAGFHRCLNIAGGFEGRLAPDGRRGSVEGWKADGLPWRQS